MKKIFESIYLFSKLTTSLVLFTVLIIMGYFFYNEVPDASVYIGALLIVLSGIYIVYREQQKKRSIVSQTILKNTR